MIAVDTNILVYAHREDVEWHAPAAKRLGELAESSARWALPWPCVHEFFAKVTHPRIFKQPSSAREALGFLAELGRSPGITFLAETEGYLPALDLMVSRGRIIGPMVHDARIAALCAVHGVTELWTSDRDFGRFPELNTRNPLVSS